MLSQRSLAGLLGILALAGCDLVAGPDGGRTRILLSQATGSEAAFTVAEEAEIGAYHDGSRGGGAKIALVESLEVTITAVQAQPVDSLGEYPSPFDFGAWETLTFGAPVTVDLLTLPTGEAGVEIISGDLPPGSYGRLRFLVSEAELILEAPLTLGRHTLPALEPIAVFIPNPWIKVPGAVFTVTEAGATVPIQFDPANSFGNLVVTGAGRVQITPVLRGHRWHDDRWRESSDPRRDGDDDDDD